jgi:ABC-2 type transport system permease protein
VALGVLIVAGLVAGVSAWLGAATQHSGLSIVTLLAAGINLVPPSLVILGVGLLAFGIRPRLTSWVVYGLLGWSLLLVIVGGIGAVGHWVLDTSVFHQMASAPAVAPHWEADAIMAAIGIGSALVGGWAFRRRDVQGE